MAFFPADKNVFAEKTQQRRSFSDSKLTFLYNQYFVSTQEMTVLYLKLPVQGSATDCPLKSVLKFKTNVGAQYSLVAQTAKHLPTMQEPQIRSLGWEDPWRGKWQPIPVFLSRKSHGQRGLVGYSPWGPKESDTT